MSFAREAWPFVLPFLAAAGLALLLGSKRSALGLALVALLVLAFFRVPRRLPDAAPDAVLAAANGKILSVETVQAPEIGPGSFWRIATFLSVFNVHVQRSPVSGRVVTSQFTEGRKVAAFRPDAAEVNQSHLLVIERANGDRVGMRQIAGLVARRVVCHAKKGEPVTRGDLVGLIKFGSRVDLYVPAEYRILAAKGDTVTEGLSVVAEGP